MLTYINLSYCLKATENFKCQCKDLILFRGCQIEMFAVTVFQNLAAAVVIG